MKKRYTISKRITIIVAAIVVIFSSIATSLISIKKVSAISANEAEPAEAISALDAKIRNNTLYYCLINTPVESDETINNYVDTQIRVGVEMIFDTDSSIWKDDGSVIVPFNFGSTYIKDGELKCEQAFVGYSGSGQTFQSPTSDSKIHNMSSDQAVIDMMSALGYSYTLDTSENTDKGCFYLEINTNAAPVDGNTYISDGTASTNNSTNKSYRGRSNEVCFDIDANGKITQASDQGGEKTYAKFNYGYHSSQLFGSDEHTSSGDATFHLSVDPYAYISPQIIYSGSHGGYFDLYSQSLDEDGGGSSMLSWYDGQNTTWNDAKNYINQIASDMMSGSAWPATQRGWYEQCREGSGDPLIYFDSNTIASFCGLNNFFTGVTAKITEPTTGTGGVKVWSRPMPIDHDAHLEYFVGSTGSANAYTTDDAYVMYYTLLRDVYGMTFNAGSNLPECQNTTPAVDNMSVPVKVRSTGQIVYCGGVVKASDDSKIGAKGTAEKKGKFSKDGKVNAIETVGGFTLAHMGGDDLLAKLNALNISEVSDEHIVMIDDCDENPEAAGCNGGGNDGTGPSTETPEAEEDECDPSIEANTRDVGCQEKGCYKEAGSMGWIICPVIFGIHGFVDNIYNKAIAPLLAVDEGIVYDLGQMNNQSATYKAWALFRNIANILFAIVLLVVVFSQVTGFGIDNYGVKKILPKLIVTAILVNLSFIICGLLVDISNMLGAGIKGLFENAAGTVVIAGIQSDSAKMTGIIVEGILILLAGGGMAAGAMAFASGAITGWSIVLPLLLILLAAVITVICAVIVLGARQAIILILIVVSPFAFVCYALPNLNGLFKKWLKLFEAMLLVFPICGALVGGGYFASCIMLGANSEGSILMLIMSAIVCMVPYFLIPSVTSRAMNAIGGLAGRVMGMGRGVSNGIGNRARNSEAYKNRIKNSQDAARARAANRYLNSRRGRRDLAEVQAGNGNNVSRARRARLATALQNANSDYETNKGILDAAQNRDNIASGNQQAVDEFKRGQASADLAHTVGELGAMTQSAELKRQSEHWSNQYSNTNSASDLSNEMNALLHSDPTLSSTESKARFAAIMDRQKAINPKAYADTARNIINSGTNEAKQELQNHMRNNEEIASKFGLKQFLKEEASAGTTSQQMQDKQAGKDTKSLLAMDDDIIQSYEGLAGATGLSAEQNAIVQNMTRAADDILANPKMAEGLESKSLDTIAKIASGGTIDNWNAYKQSVSNDMITIGGENFRRSKLPSTENIDNVSGRIITYKDGSKYNADTGELTLSTPHPNPGPNPGPGTGGAP